MLERLRVANLSLAIFGAAVFAALFAYVVFAPRDFDRRTREFATGVVQTRAEQTLRDIAHSDQAESAAEFAGIFSGRLETEIKALQESVDAGIPQMIADILAAACRLDCERKEAAEKSIMQTYGALIDRYGEALERARQMVVAEYDDVMNELRGDIRIFAGSTLIAFLAAAALALFKKKAAAHLIPVSVALSMATIAAIAWYAFAQDWVMTIIFNDYWGWSYASVIAFIWVLLADIAINRARITTAILNSFGNVAGSINLSPC